MIEEDAKKKWCPMIRMNPITGEEQYSGVTTRENSDEHRNCIASACMMWRDVPAMEAFLGNGDGIDWIKRHRALFGSSLKDAVEAKKAGKPVPCGGYCGLGGRP